MFCSALLQTGNAQTTTTVEYGLVEADAGNYIALNAALEATDTHYRVSKNNITWVIERRQFTGAWQRVPCETRCYFRKSRESEIRSMFPATWRRKAGIDCVQNTAISFCKYSDKTPPHISGYAIISHAEGKITLTLLKRSP
jgi:hypothetical protein